MLLINFELYYNLNFRVKQNNVTMIMKRNLFTKTYNCFKEMKNTIYSWKHRFT